MPIIINGNTVNSVALGNQELYAVAIGSTIVWQASTVARGTLFMVGRDSSNNGNLYSVDIDTGVATKIGSSTDFGGIETQPTGLAAIGSTLYMVGSGEDALLSVNTTTGVAVLFAGTQGTAGNFGLAFPQPWGLAAIGSTLYMVDRGDRALYTISTSRQGLSGIATKVGSSSFRNRNFGGVESSPTGLAAIGNTLYMVGSANEALYTVNTSTGAATRVGSASQFGVNESRPSGLTAIGNTLYMVGLTNRALYLLNPSTGGATRIGSAFQFGIGESEPYDIAFIPD